MLTSLFDTAVDGGGTGLVPGSHRLPSPPERTLKRSFLGGHGHFHKPDSHHPRFGAGGRGARPWHGKRGEDLPSERMPNHVNTCVPAGWAVVMDVSCWHTALANTSGTDRVYTICGYTRAVGEGSRPTRQPSAVHRRLEDAGLLPVSRKRVLGLELSPQEEEGWESGELMTPEVGGALEWLGGVLGAEMSR